MQKVNINHDTKKSAQFAEVGKWMLAGKGRRQDAAALARAARAPDLVCEILEKAAVAPGVLSDPSWAGDAATFQSLAAAFIDSLANVGVFDRLLSSMKRIPFHATGAVVTAGAIGAKVDEGDWSPLSTVELAASDPLSVLKAVALVAVSNDLVRSTSPEAQALLRRELQTATALVTDQEFLANIASGISPVASSSGADVASVRADLSSLLQAVSVGQASRLNIVMHSRNAKAIATMGGEGDFPFSGMTPQGGALCGMPVLVADAIADDEVMLIDCSGIVASAGAVTLETAEHATLRMSSTPSSEASLTSLWQANMAALKAVRHFSAQRARADAVAIVDGVNYGGETA